MTNAARLLKAFLTLEESLGVPPRPAGSVVTGSATAPCAEGLVEQDARTWGYRLGLALLRWRGRPRPHGSARRGRAVLAELREQTAESCQVGMLDGHEVVYVDRLESPQALRLFTHGRRVPLHCTSSGKILLAHLPPSLSRERCWPTADDSVRRARSPAARRCATNSSPSPGAGWAEAIEEREVGVASIAVPIRDVTGSVVAALSIGAPLARLGQAARRRLAPILVEAGEAASRRLGWSPETEHAAQYAGPHTGHYAEQRTMLRKEG